ncbi:hypothetical protein [Halocella sp. SP3-1]|uniref:hypothetical protein n=1 Tax=Halocella sp. SP3-1 TaxID=2382161 RepID=UPI000F758636|nr:hypothetical protein [Halocella sp. SP3-1]AZO96075.1 hypothetical protein D7D81_16580 [Halocella sp. SP3-1]
MSKNRTYSMSEGMAVAKQASNDIEEWLCKLNNTVSVENVEKIPEYQERDIDLIWKTEKGKYLVEIKGDRWHQTGNFFFETYSNKDKGTPGCFIYSEANLFFYYFVKPKTLYILPMEKTRQWFGKRIEQFKKCETTTPVGKGRFYTTVGRLVPIKRILKGISEIKIYSL